MKRQVPLVAALFVFLSSPAAGATVSLQGDFAEGGVPLGAPAPGVRYFGSWRSPETGDKGRGLLASAVFDTPESLSVYLSGGPMKEGVRVYLKDEADGPVQPLVVPFNPAQRWQLFTWRLPETLQGRPSRFIVEDASAEVWVGASEPIAGRPKDSGSIGGFILQLGLRYLLMLAPGLSAVFFLLRKRDMSAASVLGVCATVSAGLAYLTFWIFFLGPAAGAWIARGLNAASLAGLALGLQVPRRRLTGLREAWVVIACAGSFALFFSSVGWLYGGYDHAFALAASRFSHMLPGDHMLQFVFAQRLREGTPLAPFIGDWLSSDRPPLQAALSLWQPPFGDPRLAYQATAMLAQQFFVWGLWLLLRALKSPPAAAALALATCLVSGFFCLNSFYVWPKLLPAGFALIGTAFLLLKEGRRGDLLAAAAFALAMLGHEGSAFCLAALILPLALMRLLPTPRRALIMLAVMAALLAPWRIYVKFFDPPGNRLVKWNIANAPEIDARSTWEALRDGYGSLSAAQIARNKAENFAVPFGWSDGLDVLREITREGLLQARQRIRAGAFYDLTHALGWLTLGLPAFFFLLSSKKRGRSPAMRAAGFLLLYGAGIFLLWAMAMFGPGTTILHAGTYVLPIVIQAGAALALYALSPRLLGAIIGLRLVSFAVVWAPMLAATSAFPNGILAAQLDPAAAAVSVVALLETAILLYDLGRRSAA